MRLGKGRNTDLVVKPNWIAHVSSVFRRCGVLQSSFVCDQISFSSIFISFGFRMLSARTDLLVRLEIVLILSRSLKLLICQNDIKVILVFHSYGNRHKITGYSERKFPVFSSYISLRISSASSVSPHSIRNFGLSGKKNNHEPSIKLKKLEKLLSTRRKREFWLSTFTLEQRKEPQIDSNCGM